MFNTMRSVANSAFKMALPIILMTVGSFCSAELKSISQTLTEIGIESTDIPNDQVWAALSYRERVCTMRRVLSSPGGMNALVNHWIDRVFSLSEKAKSALVPQVAYLAKAQQTQLAEIFAELLIRDFAKDSARDLKNCNLFREWVIRRTDLKKTDNIAQPCGASERRQWLISLFLSKPFIEQEVASYREKLPAELQRMYESSLEMGDLVAVISINLAAKADSLTVKKEPFGVPPGPYACLETDTRPSQNPVISTSFYYWYDFPTVSEPAQSDGNLKSESKLEQVFSVSPLIRTGMNYGDSNWYLREVNEIFQTGINTILPVYRGGPLGRFRYADEGLGYLSRALMTHSLKVGLLLDGFLFSAQGNGKQIAIDLSTEWGAYFLFATARNFYSMIPESVRARYQDKLLIYLKDLSQARSVMPRTFAEFSQLFEATFGKAPFILFPRDEMTAYVNKGDSEAKTKAVEKLARGVMTTHEVMASLLGSEQFTSRLGANILDRKRYIEYGVCGYVKDEHLKWADKYGVFYNIDTVAKILLTTCMHNILERYQERILGIEPNYTPISQYYQPSNHSELRAKDLLTHLADLYASQKFFRLAGGSESAFRSYLLTSLTGHCASPSDLREFDRMLRLWNRQQAVSNLLRKTKNLDYFVAQWIVDYTMADPLAVSRDISWDGAECVKPGRVVTISPGYDDSKVAQLLYQTKNQTSKNGDNYRSAYSSRWAGVLSRGLYPAFVHIESWNGYHDATAIAPTLEYGNKYMTLTRKNIALYQNGYSKKGEASLTTGVKRSITSLPESAEKRNQRWILDQ